MDKFTPGPWEILQFDETGGYDCMTGAIQVGPVLLDAKDYGQKNCDYGHTPPERMVADARLIAAAPELLEALRGALGALEMDVEAGVDSGDVDWEGIARRRLRAALAAIAKATGDV